MRAFGRVNQINTWPVPYVGVHSVSAEQITTFVAMS